MILQSITLETARLLGILLDLFSAILLSIVLLTLPGLPVPLRRPSTRRFVHWTLCGLVFCAVNILDIYFWLRPEHAALFAGIDLLECICTTVFFSQQTAFILRYVGEDIPLSRWLSRISNALYGILLLFPLIPPLRRQFSYLPNELGDSLPAPLISVTFSLYILAELPAFYALFLGRKTLSRRNSTILIVLLITTILHWLFYLPFTCFTIFIAAFIILVSYITLFEQRMLVLAAQEAAMAEQAVRLQNLQTELTLSQIQPHFLYNALASIAALCDHDPRRAKELTLDFSHYLRANLKTLKSDGPIPFAQELEHTLVYLRIEKERFGERLDYSLDIGPEAFDLPALTVQPLVENAVKHGLCPLREGGRVTISTRETDAGFEIRVQDNGAGFDPAAVDWEDGTHIGIVNARKRLEHFCGGSLRIESTPGCGTTATVLLPGNGH